MHFGWLDLITPAHLASIVIGAACGVIGGAIPGLSSAGTLALMLPFVLNVSPLAAIVVLASAYTGAQYGGSITATLFNTPGAPESAVMTIDGFALSSAGLGRKALVGALWAGLIGGLLGVMVLIFFAPWLATQALYFGPPEFTALAILGLTVMASLGKGSVIKGFFAGSLGMLISAVGIDPIGGEPRLTFGMSDLLGGIPLIPALIGLFAISESLRLISSRIGEGVTRLSVQQKSSFTWKDFVGTIRYVVVGSIVGVFVGVKPGGGATIASWLAYSAARAVAPPDERKRFGSGAMGGLLAPEAADKATVGAALIPLLSLGIPASASGAVILGAFQLHDLLPGPMLFTNSPELVQALFVSLILANVAVLLIGRMLIEPLLKIRSLDTGLLALGIFVISTLGAYAYGGSVWDVVVATLIGVLGFGLHLAQVPLAPVVLGMVIGPLFEVNLRRSLIMSDGSWAIFASRPTALALLVASIAFLVLPVGLRIASRRTVAAGSGSLREP
jgi:putative tricarboxylic transport membrane protein